ncbi:hypothetical protein D9737_11700 [Escherichia sp. E10V4]|nr:hypothetical protein D9737_11700 [Escherichia sp. E10V4]
MLAINIKTIFYSIKTRQFGVVFFFICVLWFVILFNGAMVVKKIVFIRKCKIFGERNELKKCRCRSK